MEESGASGIAAAGRQASRGGKMNVINRKTENSFSTLNTF
jgi:hypothetical protein